MRKILSMAILVTALGALITGCDDSKKSVDVTGVSVSPSSLSLTVGESGTLTASVSPSNATNTNVTWSSNAPAVASVQNGQVTALTVGTATITVMTEEKGYTASCLVTVTPIRVESISVSPAGPFEMLPGQTQQLSATVLPANAGDPSYSWSSSDEKVATVSSSGLITAVWGGNATITATTTDGAKTASVQVHVTSPVNGVSLDVNEKTVYAGYSYKLTATINPVDATEQGLIWSTSDESVITVGQDGSFAALKEGTAVITVTTVDGGFTDTCTVTVKPTGDKVDEDDYGTFE